MNIDWQAYLDKSLSLSEMERAKDLLRDDPNARCEFEALVAFREKVKAAALREHVPLATLQQDLSSIAPTNVGNRRWKLAAAACIALLSISFAVYRINTDVVKNQSVAQREDRLVTNDISQAQQWALTNCGLDVPTLSFAGVASLQSVHGGKQWSCFDFDFEGKTMHVYVFKSTLQPSNCRKVKGLGGEIFLSTSGATAAFLRNGLIFRFSGGTQEDCTSLAELASVELLGRVI